MGNAHDGLEEGYLKHLKKKILMVKSQCLKRKSATEMPPLLEGNRAARGPLCLLGGDLQDPRKAGHGENFSLGKLDSIYGLLLSPKLLSSI